MSFEVYTINLVIGVVTFFILHWSLKKLIKTDRILRITLTWVGTVVLTPLIYIGLLFTVFSVMFYEPSTDFDKEKWFANKSERFEMRDDLVNSGLLKNKSKQEVLDLLGPPDLIADTINTWDYDLGISGAGLGWQFNNLILTFEQGRVAKVEKKEILD